MAWNKIKTGVLLTILCAVPLVFLAVFSGQASQEPQRAPINPGFLRHLDDLKERAALQKKEEGNELGHIPPLIELPRTSDRKILTALQTYPAYYDLRSHGKLTPVRNQGGCGSCWAFATMASLESFLLPVETWDFSEQDLIDNHGYDPAACSGGNHWMSTALLTRWDGPINEADNPYLYGNNLLGQTQKHTQNVLFVPSRSGHLDNDTIKQAIMTYGAFYVFFYYNPAHYNSSQYAYYCSTMMTSNHAVAVVGWDDNFDRTRFGTFPPGDGAFICKNSWGASWGESGYFYISYYDTSFGPGAVFTGEPTNNYAGIYQYDPLGWIVSYGYGTNVAWGANIFSATSNDPLRAISTYTASADSGYTVYVYTGLTAGNPRSGALMASKSGIFSSPGYFTIVLDEPVPLAIGQTFSIVVRYETPGYGYPIPVEEVYPGYSSGASSSPGQSFWSLNGSSWSDASARAEQTNICIKGFTQSTVTQPKISGTVRTSAGSGLSGVTILGLPSNPVTSASGFYSDTVYSGWTGTVTPMKTGTTFSPSSRSYTKVMANQLTEDYTASSGGCSYTVSPAAHFLPNAGGMGSVTVTSGGGCSWSAVSNDSWIAITSGSSGSGNGAVQFAVSANAGSLSRSGTMVVAGQTVTVHQEGGINFNASFGHIILPECIWAPATGGGTWVSEVQITDVTGGSMVSAYFSSGGGIRRGPITVWNNSGGERKSVKFANFLSFLGSIDAGFSYYGRVGAVEFSTQDANHRIQVVARTQNGDYSKTFPGLIPAEENTAVVTRPMMIQNFTNSAATRSTCGFFNPTTNSLTVEFRLFDGNGGLIGSAFSKSFVGYDFKAFNPFNEAGRPYTSFSYDNAYLVVNPTSGSGHLVCFGASANNSSNDPAAHVALHYQGSFDNSPSDDIVLPECIWALATGGGTWISEVQVTDLSGGSAVSAYFAYGGGARRGPFTVWTNSGGPGRSRKFSNFLSTLAGIDTGFTYYGRVGAVEFITQDTSHKIQVAARTLNGNYSKTFPGLRPVDSNTADTSREMIIQNCINNVTYRSTCGFFNPTSSPVTVEFQLYNGIGASIGAAFTKNFAAYDFQAFNPFNEAGIPYPGMSSDNTILAVKPTSGSGEVICFGASANNTSNDPAAHIALQYR